MKKQDSNRVAPGARVHVRGTYRKTVRVPARKGGWERWAVLTDIVDTPSGVPFRNQHFRCGPTFDRLGQLTDGDVLGFSARVELRRNLTPRQEKRSALMPPADVYRLLNPTKLVRAPLPIVDSSSQVSTARATPPDANAERPFRGSRTVELQWRDALTPHPLNQQIYGDHADESLVESVRRLGVQTPLLVTRDGTIIAGHRRWDAVHRADLLQVPVVVVECGDELETTELIIELNRQRVKTNEQLGREADALHRVEAQRAKQRQAAAAAATNAQRSGDTLPPNSAEASDAGQTRDKVAQALGVGKQKAEQANKVVRIIDRLIAEGKRREAEQLRETLNAQSVHAAYTQAQEAGHIAKSTNRDDHPSEATAGYSVLYLNPPWPTGPSDHPAYAGEFAACLAAVSPRRLANAAAENAILFVRTTNTMLAHAMKLISKCGFEYRVHVVLVHASTTDLAACDHHAVLLIATRGAAPPAIHLDSSILTAAGNRYEEQAAIFELVDRLANGETVLQAIGSPTRAGWAALGRSDAPAGNADNLNLKEAS